MIETIPHEQQRYATCGDWFFDQRFVCNTCGHMEANNKSETTATCPKCSKPILATDITETLLIRVSKLSDWRREALIAIHELVEVLLCKHDGVTQDSVDIFDKQFEATRHPDNFDEPGDEPSAPYVRQHCIATGIERLLAASLGVSWKEYEQELERLP